MREMRVERRGGEKGWLGRRFFFFFGRESSDVER